MLGMNLYTYNPSMLEARVAQSGDEGQLQPKSMVKVNIG